MVYCCKLVPHPKHNDNNLYVLDFLLSGVSRAEQALVIRCLVSARRWRRPRLQMMVPVRRTTSFGSSVHPSVSGGRSVFTHRFTSCCVVVQMAKLAATLNAVVSISTCFCSRKDNPLHLKLTQVLSQIRRYFFIF